MTNNTQFLQKLINGTIYYTNRMIEDLLYMIAGFAVTYLSLEIAWHLTACKIKDNSKIKPSMFKEIKTVLIAPQTRAGRIY